MTAKEKTQYMRSSLGMVGIAVDNRTAELLWRMYEGVLAKGADFSLKDAAKIETTAYVWEENPEPAPGTKYQPTILHILEHFLNDYWRNSAGRPDIKAWLGIKGIEHGTILTNTELNRKTLIDIVTQLYNEYEGTKDWNWNQRMDIPKWVAHELNHPDLHEPSTTKEQKSTKES